jgi:hypothetical protein
MILDASSAPQNWALSCELHRANKKRICYALRVDERRKRVLAIVAGILVTRHLKTADDLFDTKPRPRTESMVAAAVRWAERIMRKIDTLFRT